MNVLSNKDTRWYVDCLDSDSEHSIEANSRYCLDEIQEIFKQNTGILSARFLHFPHYELSTSTIKTFDDYIKSLCQSMIICVDGGYFEIYSKNYLLLESLANEVAKMSVEYFEWIDDNNVEREIFTV